MKKTKIIAEIGINHNGDVKVAKKLIQLANIAGCTHVKFQKRNPDVCVPESQKSKPKSTPWGDMTYLEYKHRIEFGKKEYDEIDRFCKEVGIEWLASVWDKDSVDFMQQYKNADGESVMKIPSALITDNELISYAREKSDILLISTGMSNEKEIEEAVSMCKPDVIFHTNSTYPTPVDELNLGYINWLKEKYPNKEIATISMGVTWVERHITIDRNMWGSDQKSSIEPSGLIKLVKGIRGIEVSLSGYGPRKCMGGELEKRKSLRG
jgi:N-acetylneuraminate synthase